MDFTTQTTVLNGEPCPVTVTITISIYSTDTRQGHEDIVVWSQGHGKLFANQIKKSWNNSSNSLLFCNCDFQYNYCVKDLKFVWFFLVVTFSPSLLWLINKPSPEIQRVCVSYPLGYANIGRNTKWIRQQSRGEWSTEKITQNPFFCGTNNRKRIYCIFHKDTFSRLLLKCSSWCRCYCCYPCVSYVTYGYHATERAESPTHADTFFCPITSSRRSKSSWSKVLLSMLPRVWEMRADYLNALWYSHSFILFERILCVRVYGYVCANVCVPVIFLRETIESNIVVRCTEV